MKKTMTRFISMAALTLMGAIITACSSSDDTPQPVITPQQPENTSKTVTLTTTVGLGDGSATTRALTIDGDKGVKTFAAGDQIALIYMQNSGATAKAVSAALPEGTYGKSAEFTFTLDDPDKTKDVTYIYPAAMAGETGVDYSKLSSQTGGTLTDLGSKYDLATYTHAWDGDNLPGATLENQLAILAITLKDDAETPADITSNITGMTISDGTNSYAVTRSAAAGPIYVAIRPTTGATFNVTATDGTNNYVKTLTGKTYKINNGYNVGWRMLPAVIDLSSLSGQITVINGQTLTGTLNSARKISIAAGAEVTLRDVTIIKNTTSGSRSYIISEYAGITCEGNATIILSGTNTVKGFDSQYPGIQAGPEGTTLTIDGTGTLEASSSANGKCPGIGANDGGSCGDITIQGSANVTATGGQAAAGIGCGNYGQCGNILIGGTATVTATGGEAFTMIGVAAGAAAGIGTGTNGQCGTITIESTVSRVTATKGSGASNSIGRGNSDNSTCGTVTIGGTVYWDGSAYQNDGVSILTQNKFVYPIESLDVNGVIIKYSVGETWRQAITDHSTLNTGWSIDDEKVKYTSYGTLKKNVNHINESVNPDEVICSGTYMWVEVTP